MTYAMSPIGVVRSPFSERVEAPRQATLSTGCEGRIELFSGRGFEDALDGLEGWERAWVLFVFHRNVEQERGWRPKVLPPRAERRVGVFATRSPHRPNPIGMSVVRIVSVDRLVVHVRELDMLDGTPVLDIKPYVPYADAHPGSGSGWLETAADPRARWEVRFTDDALAQLAWLRARGVDLQAGIESSLALGPQPHAYRRIRAHAGGRTLAMKEWRVDFAVEGTRIVVRGLATGYRPAQLASDERLALHREFSTYLGAQKSAPSTGNPGGRP